MNYFKASIPGALRPRLRTRALAALALLVLSIVIAGCGSSGETGTITIGNENTADNALAKSEPETKTPTSGPLSEEPKIVPPKTPAPTKLVSKDLIVGTGAEAKKGSDVTVNYVGALYKNGKVFDASWKRKEPFVFVIGTKEVIQGWEEGVVGMKVGGRRELIIPSALAYGKTGNSSIGPNEPLIFVVDLLKVK